MIVCIIFNVLYIIPRLECGALVVFDSTKKLVCLDGSFDGFLI